MDLWTMELNRPLTEAEEAALLALLPPERRQRLVKTKQRSRWREPLCAYGLLRLALRRSLGWRALPAVARSPGGKPWFPAAPQVCFSLSHTPGAVLVGLSHRDLGVDIQQFRPVGRRLMERTGAAEETAFFRDWVRREALAKRRDVGVAALLGRETPLLPGEAFWPLETFPGYAAGAAGTAEDPPETLRRQAIEDLL